MAATPKLIKFEEIDASAVVVAPRGRKVETDPSLTAAFATLADDKALNLKAMFGTVDPEDRPKVGGTIRKNWRAVREDECRVDFGTTGEPTVRKDAAKTARKAAEREAAAKANA